MRFFIVALAILSACNRPQPAEVAEGLLSAPHGLEGMDPEAKKLVAEVKRNPRPYIPLLAPKLEPQAVLSARRPEEPAIAARVLILHCGDEGRAEARKRLEALFAESDPMKGRLDGGQLGHEEARDLRRVYSTLSLLEGAMFDDFADAGDAALKDIALRRLALGDIDHEAIVVQYLDRVLRDDPEVQEALRKHRGGE